jgi:chemotaxis protein methyltransferase CheR
MFDLILCRNVTIYFSPEATQQLYRRFAGALEPGGWLVLGPSDPVPDLGSGLEAVRRPGGLLWRRPERAAHTTDLPTPRVTRSPLRPAPARKLPARPLPARPQPVPLPVVATPPVVGEQAQARPLDPAAHLQLGMLLLEQGKTSLAIESLRRAAFLDPQHALAHFGLGQAYYQDGDMARARVALRQARSLAAAIPAGEMLPGSDELSVERFRHAIDMLFAALDRS